MPLPTACRCLYHALHKLYDAQRLVAGEALHRATSREQQVAEIRFKDALGNVAHAESVNCYAEPVQVIGLTTHAVELCLPDWLREGEANVTAVISSELI